MELGGRVGLGSRWFCRRRFGQVLGCTKMWERMIGILCFVGGGDGTRWREGRIVESLCVCYLVESKDNTVEEMLLL